MNTIHQLSQVTVEDMQATLRPFQVALLGLAYVGVVDARSRLGANLPSLDRLQAALSAEIQKL